MKTETDEFDRTTRILRRVARIWSAIILITGVIIFVAEVIEAFTTNLEPYPWYENLIPLTLFTAIVGLALAWRWEGLGGLITCTSVLVNLGIYLLTGRGVVGMVMLILAPILIPGVLFLACWYRTRGKKSVVVSGP